MHTQSSPISWFLLLPLMVCGIPGVLLADDGPTKAPAEAAVLRDYLSANGLLNRGMFDLAAAEYRKFLTHHGRHAKAPVARYGLAVCLYRLGRYEAAGEELEKLAGDRKFAYAAEVQAMLGHCQLARQQHGPAIKTCSRFLQKHGEHELAADVAAMLVEGLYRDGEYQRAVDRAGAFVERWPDSALRERVLLFWCLALTAQRDWPAATERYSELLQAFPETSYRDQVTYLLAQCYDQRNALVEAARWYRSVLDQADSPYVPDALLGLATLLYRQKKPDQAGPLLDRLLASTAGTEPGRYKSMETGRHESADSPLRARALLLRGRTWFDQGKYDRAGETFKQLASQDGELADAAAYWLAKCKLRAGDYADAANRLGRALKEYSESGLLAEMRYDRAVALVQKGDDDAAARKALEGFRAGHPQHEMAADALHLLATVEHRQRQFDRSQEHCEAFLREYPKHPLVAATAFLAAENDFLSGRYADAVKRYQAFLERHGGDPQAKAATFRLGMALYRLERFDEALGPLGEAAALLEQEPAFRPSLLALGDICFERSEWKQAEEHLSDYLSAGLEVAAADDALLKLGLAQQRQGKHEQARQAHERLLEKFPQSPHRLHARFELGQTLVALKRPDEAAAAFERVLKGGSDSRFAPFALNHLGMLALQNKDYVAAAKHLAEVLERKPDPALAAQALLQRGQALLAAQRYAEAEESFARFLNENPTHAQAAMARAQLAVAVARQDRAADALKIVAEVERKGSASIDASVLAALGYEKAWCLRKLGNSDEAAKAYRQLLQRDDGGNQRAYALLELAELKAAAGRCGEAITLLQRLRKDSPGPDKVPAEILAQATYRHGVCEFERDNFDQAAKLLEEFLQKNAKHALAASASYFCGEAHFKLGRHRQAVEHLSRVAESFQSDPVCGPSLLRLGESLAVLQHWDRSERVFGEYLRKFKDDQHWYQAQFGIGWARENQGRLDEAMAAYRPVVERHQGPTAARAQFQIGQCLFAQKKYDQAVRELLKVDILYAYPQWSAAALFEAGRCFEKMGKLVEARRQFETVRDKYAQTRWAEMAGEHLAAVSSGGLPGKGGK